MAQSGFLAEAGDRHGRAAFVAGSWSFEAQGRQVP
jgi:hypothetical protein